MNRVDALRHIFSRHQDAFFVLSNGLTSREAASFADQENSFYLLHAMGEALSVGIGLATSRPDLPVVVIDGDGNALMGLASWSMMPVPNLFYYILQNGLFETTGGQSLPGLPVTPAWCTVIEVTPGKARTPNPPPPLAIWQKTQGWLAARDHQQGAPHGPNDHF